MGVIPYPNIKQIADQARQGVPAAKLLMVAIALVMTLAPSNFPNGRTVLERLKQMAERYDENEPQV